MTKRMRTNEKDFLTDIMKAVKIKHGTQEKDEDQSERKTTRDLASRSTSKLNYHLVFIQP